MKQKLLLFFTAGCLLAACNNEKKADDGKKENDATVKSTEKTETDTAPAGPPDSATQAAMMKAWQDFATPGEMHKWMAKHAGTWEAEVSQWMDPAAPPSKAAAKDVVTMSMNGLYQQGDFTSTMMGQPLTGRSTLGYDNAKKQFVMTWIDNLGSGIVFMTGNYDEATKTLHLKGKQTDAYTGKDSDIRQEQKFIDDDTYTFTMFGAGHDGKEHKFLEGTFKRKK